MNILARILTALGGQRPTPTTCACGRKADVIDTDRPWIVYCGKCYLRKIGKL